MYEKILKHVKLPVSLDLQSGYIFDADMKHVAETRGWGWIQKLDKPHEFQDAMGQFFVDCINNTLSQLQTGQKEIKSKEEVLKEAVKEAYYKDNKMCFLSREKQVIYQAMDTFANQFPASQNIAHTERKEIAEELGLLKIHSEHLESRLKQADEYIEKHQTQALEKQIPLPNAIDWEKVKGKMYDILTSTESDGLDEIIDYLKNHFNSWRTYD